mmetsp:Transcript_9751/g.15970  ORF Transcript_9751/g.15970 Transcript_9751/m.15970 type:complete len:88 (-) Transcript_9751:950-1213(-)
MRLLLLWNTQCYTGVNDKYRGLYIWCNALMDGSGWSDAVQRDRKKQYSIYWQWGGEPKAHCAVAGLSPADSLFVDELESRQLEFGLH